MIYFFKKQFLLLILFFAVSTLMAQVDRSDKIVFGESDTLSIVDDNDVELGEDECDEDYQEVGKEESMIYIYFDWMPGYGTYNNFDILTTHYKHETSLAADTLILGNYVHPAPYKVYSKYGRRRRGMHYGIDLSYPTGTPVVAAFDGIVRISKSRAGGYGDLIVIRHDNKLETYYAHLSRRLVNPGQLVSAGDTIGLGGSTGRSTGPHLHFEVRYMGVPFNPERIIDCNEFKLKVDTLYTSGKEIKITSPVMNPQANDTPPSKLYITVKKGQTLGHIARRYRTTVYKLKKLNRLKSDFIREGQRLRVR
ncbi:MAG TPA: peptidoglycan DD-metalloendopeptidase family protein [Bacteroidales bacterium]|jgi:murein DD-endopeptidase MepM/ murein hydrolase activator NlpD|nr:peptidoglycan DD-metalloendopeptidase family protein [Bacteroidales bacterium]